MQNEIIGIVLGIFPSCRPYFARNDVYNFKNDAERRSLDDIF